MTYLLMMLLGIGALSMFDIKSLLGDQMPSAFDAEDEPDPDASNLTLQAGTLTNVPATDESDNIQLQTPSDFGPLGEVVTVAAGAQNAGTTNCDIAYVGADGTFSAGNGNDILISQNGFVDAGSGDDYLHSNATDPTAEIAGRKGDDTFFIYGAGTARGANGDDVFHLFGQNIWANGGDNDDIFYGYDTAANIVAIGDKGHDIFHLKENATIEAGSGNDVIDLYAGQLVSAGTGLDTFVVPQLAHSDTPVMITDFSVVDDVIVVTASGFDGVDPKVAGEIGHSFGQGDGGIFLSFHQYALDGETILATESVFLAGVLAEQANYIDINYLPTSPSNDLTPTTTYVDHSAIVRYPADISVCDLKDFTIETANDTREVMINIDQTVQGDFSLLHNTQTNDDGSEQHFAYVLRAPVELADVVPLTSQDLGLDHFFALEPFEFWGRVDLGSYPVGTDAEVATSQVDIQIVRSTSWV